METKEIVANIKRELREGRVSEAERLLFVHWVRIPYREASAIQAKIRQAKSDTRVYG